MQLRTTNAVVTQRAPHGAPARTQGTCRVQAPLADPLNQDSDVAASGGRRTRGRHRAQRRDSTRSVVAIVDTGPGVHTPGTSTSSSKVGRRLTNAEAEVEAESGCELRPQAHPTSPTPRSPVADTLSIRSHRVPV